MTAGGKPLKILHVLRKPIGGLYRHVVDLSQGLAARGYDVGIVMDGERLDAQTEARLEPLRAHLRLGVHMVSIPALLGPGDFVTPLKLARLAAELKVDIMHGHGAKGGFHARLAKLAGAKAKAVYTPHGGALHYDKSKLSGRAFLTIEKYLLGLTDAMCFESRYALETYSSQIAEPHCFAPVVHNGLQPSEFVPTGTAEDAYEFGFVGELRTLKGIFELVEALAPLKTADGKPARLIMAGGGLEEDDLRARIASLGLQDRVVLAGVRPAREIFGMAKCLIVPSHAESLPYVVLEAVAAQKPVIATRVGGIGEIFGPTAASLITPRDTEALRAAMVNYLAAPDGAETEMQARLGHVRQNFSIETMIDGILAVYQRTVNPA